MLVQTGRKPWNTVDGWIIELHTYTVKDHTPELLAKVFGKTREEAERRADLIKRGVAELARKKARP